MSSRTGRPKSDNPKSIDIKVRIDADMNQKLLQACKENGLKRAEAIRQGIMLFLDAKK